MVWFGSRFSLVLALLFTVQVDGAGHAFAAITEVKTTSAVSGAESCARILTIKSLDDLLIAHTRGFLPDLSKSSQKDAFHVYRKMRFGDPNTNLGEETTAKIAEELKRHPELTKKPFRNYELSVQEKAYPVTKELQTLTESFTKSAGQIKGSFFQIEANLGYWKKMLGFVERNLSAEITDKKEKKAFKESEQKRFLERLGAVVSKEQRDALADAKVDARVRAKKLFELLVAEREK